MPSQYINQTKEANCVPVSTYNLLRWLGIPLRPSDLDVIEDKMWSDETGTSGFRMFSFIKEFWNDFVSVKRMSSPTTKKIKRELVAGNSILVDVGARRWASGSTQHFFFISGYQDGKFLTHNMIVGHKRLQPLTAREMYDLYADDLRKEINDFSDTPSAFYICTKKEPS